MASLFAVIGAGLAFTTLHPNASGAHSAAAVVPAKALVFPAHRGDAAMKLAPPSLCLFAALAVGAESALGGWLTTYGGRTGHGASLTVSAVTAFWAGLLLSRTFHASARAAAWSIRGHILLAAGALAGLLLAPGGVVFLPLSMAAGWGLGPLYPYVLSLVLTEYRPRTIFLIAGVGSAVVPWLTGQVSGYTASLRWGVSVPFVAVVLLLAVGEIVRRQSSLVA